MALWAGDTTSNFASTCQLTLISVLAGFGLVSWRHL